MWRGDLIVSVNGQAMSAEAFRSFVRGTAPGSEVSIAYKRAAKPDPYAAMVQPDPNGTPGTVTFKLDALSRWMGTMGRGLREGAHLGEPAEGEFEPFILSKADQAQVRTAPGGLNELLTMFRKVQDDALDTNTLPAVAAALRRPLSLDAAERPINAGARAAASGDMGAVVRLINTAIDNPLLPDAVMRLPAWFASIGDPSEQARARADAEGLIRTIRNSSAIGTGELAASNLAAIRRGGDMQAVLSQLADLALRAEADVEAIGAAHANDAPRTDLPPDLRGAVGGDVLYWEAGAAGEGPLIVGGPGPNTYDMSKIARVYDVGGNDIYRYSPGEINVTQTLSGEGGQVTTRRRVLTRTVIDLAGDDVHEASGDFCGPATGVFGVSILDDRAGNDVYRSSGQLSIGAGLFGLGILIDRAGNDRYESTGPASGWSIGAGVYGAGVIIDVQGDDVYWGQRLTEGAGGPRGLGAIIDAAGNDLYRANGPDSPSAYGTPAVYLGMAQGFGYGVRGYAAGGIGAIYDLGGDDRYEGGEFTQGVGYYFGLGILHDAAGNDLYYGNRYSQAAAAHQAAGLLIDDAGDDTYWSMTAASQGAAWDQSTGMLIDRNGNDAYRCDGLGQGAAAQQAIGVLLDLDGMDRYAGRDTCQGEAGGNEYHYTALRVFSFGALIDLGGKQDSYSQPRSQGAAARTGDVNNEKPETSHAWGLFVDE